MTDHATDNCEQCSHILGVLGVLPDSPVPDLTGSWSSQHFPRPTPQTQSPLEALVAQVSGRASYLQTLISYWFPSQALAATLQEMLVRLCCRQPSSRTYLVL